MCKGLEIEFKNFSLNLGGNQILKDINLKIESGTIHCLIGPNGGGKSSLVKSILSMMPHEGDILMKYDDDIRIGYVPQKLDFDKTIPITVWDFFVMIYQKKPCIFRPNKELREKINDILKSIDMYDKKDRLLGELSGGELQRLSLAQSLYPRPNLLILDEPFNGIDTVCENFFIDKIKK